MFAYCAQIKVLMFTRHWSSWLDWTHLFSSTEATIDIWNTHDIMTSKPSKLLVTWLDLRHDVSWRLIEPSCSNHLQPQGTDISWNPSHRSQSASGCFPSYRQRGRLRHTQMFHMCASFDKLIVAYLIILTVITSSKDAIRWRTRNY